MNSAFTMFLLMLFEVPFGFDVHDIETAECDPKDDLKGEDAYQRPEGIVDEAQRILGLIKFLA